MAKKPKSEGYVRYHELLSKHVCVDCAKRRARKGRCQCGICAAATLRRAAARAKKAAK